MEWNVVTTKEAKALNVSIGDTVAVNGFTVEGDYPGALYQVVAQGTGVNDGVLYVDTYNGLQLKQQIDGE